MRRGQRTESNSRKRERRRELLKAKKRAANPSHEDAAEDWAQASKTRSLHDVAQAPPEITARPKERKKSVAAVEALAARPKPSLARQRILDEERERAVKEYRALKRMREDRSEPR